MKTIKIALLGCQRDYHTGVLPLLIQQLGYSLAWVKPQQCDILIYGAFFSPRKAHAWVPKPLRPMVSKMQASLEPLISARSTPPISLFHTCENKRPYALPTDFSITFDLGITSSDHLRLPYWYDVVDWSHEGITGNTNPRYGELLSLTRLKQNLGDAFLKRQRAACMITSHLQEPRKSLFAAVSRSIPVEGLGSHFDRSIKNHHQSHFVKIDELQKYAFNLCPENSLYPGYYTEKIPEAFQAGALPITWTDSNVCADFNPAAFINLEPMAYENYAPLAELLDSTEYLSQFCDQPLLLNTPTLEHAKQFIAEMIKRAL
ncbi:Glycosyltransferase family 10 (fucosyltransferase) C-term [Polynucleobacter meluiroseus]|uniref:Glycosyltransferase family 10 (Fucosyltransferase) C-term n=1 Tax=Polynucleobacter meluiroseus TaxID=1938814 RepID=A0A240E1J3_9BURK|nr:glycosyltransferase family 10 [Polynucleobacter meluiroseus]SNX29097.1 Glycosyltransferase family 10 (fucosyltransferase) C-term [Polynucleobacter meluiroseus]